MSTGKYQKRNGFRSDLSDILENGEMVEAPGSSKTFTGFGPSNCWARRAAHGMRHIRV